MISTKYKVAIIEDEPDLAEIYKMKMIMDGIDVIVINESLKAIDILKSEMPDLILLDIMMPGIDGFKLFNMIKADEQLKKIKIYIWSNLTQKKDRDQAANFKVDGYLIKSDFTPATLSAKVKELLQKIKK